MGALLWVQVPPRADHSERSEAQPRKGNRPWRGSVEHKSWADGQEPHTRRCQSGRTGNKPRSSCGQGAV